MPAQGKLFEVFAQDQATCKQFADSEVGGVGLSNLKEFGTAAVSTALGAGLGAAVRGGRGAEAGSAFGAIAGAALGARGSARDQSNLQGRYNLAYTQCMYAHGNQIGGPARAGSQVAQASPGGYSQPPGAMSRSGGAPGQTMGQTVGQTTYTYGSGVIH